MASTAATASTVPIAPTAPTATTVPTESAALTVKQSRDLKVPTWLPFKNIAML
ncbi:hypothetical protein BGZ74_008890, partial [Mortierella antarctica]